MSLPVARSLLCSCESILGGCHVFAQLAGCCCAVVRVCWVLPECYAVARVLWVVAMSLPVARYYGNTM